MGATTPTGAATPSVRNSRQHVQRSTPGGYRPIGRSGESSAATDPEGQAIISGRSAQPLGTQLDPPDERGQFVAEFFDRRAVGIHERVHGLRVGLLAFRPAWPIEEDPDRGLSGSTSGSSPYFST